MLEIVPISRQNVESLKRIYQSFQTVAEAEYGWPGDAVDFTNLKKIIQAGLMSGYLIRSFPEKQPLGFMLYSIESFQALEIKIIYLAPEVPVKTALDGLLKQFLEDIIHLEGWTVMSYPMMGSAQMRYADFITWYGFTPVGQAMMRFHIFDGISVEIFKKQALAPLPEGYSLVSWMPEYEEGVIDVLTEAFSESADALWDPRFRSREGIREALQFVQSGGYGIFWPPCTSIMLNADNQPVGVCLLNIVNQNEANIPLIGIMKSERHHKLGRTLLGRTLDQCIGEVLKGRLKIGSVSATVATQNFPAVKMYRYTAFQEMLWYPHVYQERKSVEERKPGQWCSPAKNA